MLNGGMNIIEVMVTPYLQICVIDSTKNVSSSNNGDFYYSKDDNAK
jgi:hypothetical protein